VDIVDRKKLYMDIMAKISVTVKRIKIEKEVKNL